MTPRPNLSWRPIVIGVIATSVILIGVGALLPSPLTRRIEQKRQKIKDLQRISAPKLPADPLIAIPWRQGEGDAPGRNVTIHLYQRLGKKSSRSDLLSEGYLYGSTAKGQTVIHLAFDPKRPDELRLATVLGAFSKGNRSGSTGLRHEVLSAGRGMKSKTVRQRVLLAEKTLGPERLARARDQLLRELEDGSAKAFPPETVLYEVAGRFYKGPRTGIPKSVTSYVVSFSSIEYAEAIEALTDARVLLP